MNAPALVFEGQVPGRLAPMSLRVAAGRWTCLLGPSGAGKSTLLDAFAGIVVPDGRCAALDGKPLAGRVARMAQEDLLLPWLTVAQNITLGDRLRGQRAVPRRVDELLAAVGLSGFASRKPGTLSGGQRQRVALARTLHEDRPVVLLDEPFSALDIARRIAMQDLSARLLAGRTVLHVTHDPAEAARLGDEIIILGGAGLHPVTAPRAPAPRAPDAAETLSTTGALTCLLLEAA